MFGTTCGVPTNIPGPWQERDARRLTANHTRLRGPIEGAVLTLSGGGRAIRPEPRGSTHCLFREVRPPG